MTPRQARRERREAERKAKKADIKQNLHRAPMAPETALLSEPKMQTIDQAAATQPQHNEAACPGISTKIKAKSTGPRTSEGKFVSSRNSFKHGLASGQVIVPGEDGAAFENLLNDLLQEHQPANVTEQLLVKEMAQSHWLTQRALRLQNECFTAEGVDGNRLALFLRYQTTHQRAFFKALSNLRALKKDAARGFVSQPRPQARQFVRQNPPEQDFVSQTNPKTPALPQFIPQNPTQFASGLATQPLKQAA